MKPILSIPPDLFSKVIERRPIFLIVVLAPFLIFFSLILWLTIAVSAELPVSIYRMFRGDINPWPHLNVEHNSAELLGIAAYAGTQFVALWGVGKLRLGKRPGGRYRLATAVVAIWIVTGLLTGGMAALFLGIVQMTGEAAGDHFPDAISNYKILYIVPTAWVLWLLIGLLYLRGREPSRAVSTFIGFLLAGSWIEFSVALPLYINAKDHYSGQYECPCEQGSWYTLIFCVPVLFWAVGPGLYLIYLRERALAQETPERPMGILLRKSATHRQAQNIKVENHVSSARTLSLILLVLGFIGIQVGMYNNERTALAIEARNGVILGWLQNRFSSDGGIDEQFSSGGPMQSSSSGLKELLVPSPFGEIKITHSDASDSPPYVVEVHRKNGSINIAASSLDDRQQVYAVNRLLTGLGVNVDADPAQILSEIDVKLYTRKVSVPILGLGDFDTEFASWLISIATMVVVITLMNSLSNVARGMDAGIGEPWLVLDSEGFIEGIVAVLWVVGICTSNWLAGFGLALTMIDRLYQSPFVAGLLRIAVMFTPLILLTAVGLYPPVRITADILQIRRARREIRQTEALSPVC